MASGGRFKTETIDHLCGSGWATCGSVAEAVARAGLPAITGTYLLSAFSQDTWLAGESAVAGLREHFAAARFADQTEFGLLLVPDPERLDTRRPMPPDVRRDQLDTTGDVADARLPDGALAIPPGKPWTLVATVTGPIGISLGSYLDVTSASASAFTVLGIDTRIGMTRQVWGARVLQSGANLPDSDANPRWTFTLFPGEPLTDRQAESGTVLHHHVRFRLGKPDRGIASARVAPALSC